MKPNFNIYSDILKALDFLLKKSVLTTVVFYTPKKTQKGGAFIKTDSKRMSFFKWLELFKKGHSFQISL